MQQALETLRGNETVRKSISYKVVHSCCRRETFQADLKAAGQNTFKPVVSFSWPRGYESPQVSQSLLQLWAVHKAPFQGVKDKVTSNTDPDIAEDSRMPNWPGSTAAQGTP